MRTDGGVWGQQLARSRRSLVNMFAIGSLADAIGVKWRSDVNEEGEIFFEVVNDLSDRERIDLLGPFTAHEMKLYLQGRCDERDRWHHRLRRSGLI